MPSTALPRWLMSLAALCAGVILCTSASAQRKLPPPSKEAVQYSFAPIVRQTAPAVVNVYVRSRVQSFTSPFADDPFFRRFFGDRFGQPTERHAELARLRRDRLAGRHRRHQHPRHQGRRPDRDQGRARRQARVRRQGDPAGREDATSPCCGSKAATAGSRRSSSRTRTISRSATWCWPSAIRSASARR